MKEDYHERQRSFHEMRGILDHAIVIADLQNDIEYLDSGYLSSYDDYVRILGNRNSSEDKQREAAWNCIEFSKLKQVYNCQEYVLIHFLEICCGGEPANL